MAKMELPVVDNFCFIFDLKTGCILTGIINSIITFGLAVVLIILAADFKDAADVQLRRDELETGMSSVVYTMLVLLVVLLFAKALMDLLFVYAVYKEISTIVKKYCIAWIMFLVLYIVGFLKTLFYMDALHVMAQIFYLGVNFFHIIVIRSYLISINEDGVL